MALDLPDNSDVIQDSIFSRSWYAWIARVHVVISSAQASGGTANRPTSVLWIGRRFYDTTLNKPVFVSAVKPTVWRDAAGTIV